MEQRKPQSINFESIEQIQALLEQYFKAFNIIGSAHNFATKDDIDKVEQRLEKRMDRLENKLDTTCKWQIGTIITMLLGFGGILVKLFIH